MSSEHIQGTVADGFESVRAEFAAVAAAEGVTTPLSSSRTSTGSGSSTCGPARS
ncbi:MAG TPA: hypothetical protein VGL47_14430 [Amycolatopsis sp.]|uniref:hypothetical protein n=1 Tax=Amycolatopsis sp. TaxID=37632 RepID=UPI002F3E7C16